jgi:plasmid maintenance system antidote protein VapI
METTTTDARQQQVMVLRRQRPGRVRANKPLSMHRSLADATRLSLEQVQEILARRAPVKPDVADRIGNWIGDGPRLWLNLQARWDSR